MASPAKAAPPTLAAIRNARRLARSLIVFLHASVCLTNI